MKSLRIAVVGAGLGGLTFVNTLQHLLAKDPREQHVEISVYERDLQPFDRSQGYALYLRSDMGFKALEDAGLGEHQATLMKPTHDFSMVTHHGTCLMEAKDMHKAFAAVNFVVARVSRPELKQVLCDAAAPRCTMHWNTHVVGYAQAADAVTLNFADGSTAEADIVVACDGAKSKLRTQMLGEDTNMFGVSIVSGRVPLNSANAKTYATPRMNESATCIVMGDKSNSMFMSPGREDVLSWGYGVKATPGTLPKRSKAELQEMVLDAVKDWPDPVPRLVRDTDLEQIVVRELVEPTFPKTARDGRVVLLGDAVHPMTPYMGLGANSAMLDGASLGKLLHEKITDVDSALMAYDTEMLQRTKPCVDKSAAACRSNHTEGAWNIAVRNANTYIGGCFMSAALAILRRMPARPPTKK